MPGVNARWGVPLAAVLFIVICVVRAVVDSPGEGIGVLYVVPVALLAVTGGLRAGLFAIAVATALFVGWVLLVDADLSALGYASRITAFVAVGVIVGMLVDRLRAAERRMARLVDAESFSSHVLQHLAVARLALHRGDTAAAQDAVANAQRGAQRLMDDRLPDDPRAEDFLASDTVR